MRDTADAVAAHWDIDRLGGEGLAVDLDHRQVYILDAVQVGQRQQQQVALCPRQRKGADARDGRVSERSPHVRMMRW